MLVLGALPPLAWALATVVLRQRARTWRDAMLLAAVVVGVAAALQTELASAAQALTRPVLAASWGAACVALAALAIRQPARPPLSRAHPSREVVALVAATATLLGVVGVAGVVGAPNNADSMTYHLTRVAHWAQNGAVDHYPTWIDRQLYSNPFAEWLILHLDVLTGGDRLASSVQWAALLVVVVAVTAVAERVGAGAVGQAWAGLFAATVPGAVLQGQSTQNDLVVAAALACAGVFGLDLARGRTGRLTVAGWGGGLGLAALTKGTAFLLGPLVAAAPAVAMLRRRGRRAVLPIAGAAALALALNAGHWARNVERFGHPLLPPAARPYFHVEAPLAAALASNVLRHAAFHLGTPWRGVNEALERGVRGAHVALGLDVDDPRTTFPRERFAVLAWTSHEDVVNAPAHLLLAIVGAIVVLSASRFRRARPVVAAVLVGLLTMSLLTKWQPWHSRLTLPLVVACGPFVGVVLEACLTPAVRLLVALGLVAIAGQTAVTNQSRRLIDGHVPTVDSLTLARREQYFTHAWALASPFQRAAAWLGERRVTRLGLITGPNDVQYPLWPLLPGVRIEQFCPWPDVIETLPSLRGADAQGTPEYVLTLGPGCTDRLRADGWERAWWEGPVALWRPPGAG